LEGKYKAHREGEDWKFCSHVVLLLSCIFDTYRQIDIAEAVTGSVEIVTCTAALNLALPATSTTRHEYFASKTSGKHIA
jgi:hypothetical protein